MARVSHIALDGGRVEIDGDNLSLDRPATSVAVFNVDGEPCEFTAGVRTLGEDVVKQFGFPFIEEYSFQRGMLRIASGEQVFPQTDPRAHDLSAPLHFATWEGRQFSVHAHLYVRPSSDLIEIFDHFVIIETPYGIRLVQKDAKATPQVEPPTSVLKEVPEAGLLQVRQRTEATARILPKWRGAAVRGGELFRTDGALPSDDSCGEVSFYLAGKTAIAYIAEPNPDARLEAVLRAIEMLEIGWAPGQRAAS